MSTKIIIEIVAAESGYTAQEQAILAAIQGNPAVATVAAAAAAAAPAIDMTAKTKEAADARIAETRAKTAADAKAKAAADAKAKATADARLAKAAEEAEAVAEAANAEEAAAEEVVEVEDDLLGGEETTFTKADAIAKATQLVSTQKQAVVKAALAAVGAKRVSDLNDASDIQAFMAALEA